MVQIIAVAVCSVSALIQVAVHVYAWERPWTRFWRYVAGAFVANVAATAAFFLSMEAGAAILATGYLWSVYIANGIAVGACYQGRKRTATSPHDIDPMPDASRILDKLRREETNGDLSDPS